MTTVLGAVQAKKKRFLSQTDQNLSIRQETPDRPGQTGQCKVAMMSY